MGRVATGERDAVNCAVVIPAYRPSASLLRVVEELRHDGWRALIVIDDGSGPEFADIFRQLGAMAGVTVLRHAVNLGKGAALRTGLNHVLCEYPDCLGAVTADADGQHASEDIRRVGARLGTAGESLVLGTREFRSADVPWRSRVGNQLSIGAVRLLMGQKLSDTQTGLRGLPISLIPHLLRIRSAGYEFELDMLIACKHQGYSVVEIPIRTIYEDGNRQSHFNPLLDSARVYFVLLRFSFVSLLTSALDNLIFIAALPLLGSIARAQILSRAVAVAFNYATARNAVFLSRENHRATFPRYLLLVVASGLVSYGLIRSITEWTPLGAIPAKMIAEATLFIANFAVQRDFVFRKRRTTQPSATDWDLYYRSTPATAHLTRRYTGRTISTALRRFLPTASDRPVVVELGGANSCFLERMLSDLKPGEYHVIDTNRHGLDLLRERAEGSAAPVLLHEESCLDIRTPVKADVAFSVGLIEHFDPEGTRNAIRGHFDVARPGGLVLISFPTPTLLYRAARAVVSAAGLWRFHDERPLRRDEVLATVREQGDIVYEKLMWPLIFTQHLILARKRPAA